MNATVHAIMTSPGGVPKVQMWPLSAAVTDGGQVKRKTWRCFHCDEVFTNERHAAEHFGDSQRSMTACKIKGHEHDLIAMIRDQERTLATYRDEDNAMLRAWQSRESELRQEVIRSEEAGFDRGIRAMQSLAVDQFGKRIVV